MTKIYIEVKDGRVNQVRSQSPAVEIVIIDRDDEFRHGVEEDNQRKLKQAEQAHQVWP